jgi:apolipoprotein N-acyltransferase
MSSERGRRLATVLGCVAVSVVLWRQYSRLELPGMALGVVALVPWLWVLDRARTPREAFWVGMAQNVAFALVVFSWFPEALHGFAQAPLAAVWLGWLVVSPLMQPQFVTFALARHLARRRSPEGAFWRPALAGAFAYVGTEWLLPKLFADTLGQGLYPSVYLRQGADLAGAHGLTVLLLLGNECVLALGRALATREDRRRALAPLAVLVALGMSGFGYGAWRLRQVEEHTQPGREFVVGAVQANITKYEKLAAEVGTYEVVRRVLDTHYALSDELLRQGEVDLLVWPETVYPTTFGAPKSEAGAEFDAEISAFVAERRVPLIFGAYDVDGEREYNAAMFLEPREDGRLELEAYHKSMLFPLTEWLPEPLDTPGVRQWLPWAGTWKRGAGPRAVPFRLRGGQPLTLAPLICYDTIFPGYVAEAARQGAELIVTLSNDSWFSGTPAPKLHLMHAAFRSIETRLPQVRVTNSGISALISPTGELLAQTPDGQSAHLALKAPRMTPLPTLVVAWGDWLGPVALALAALLLLAPRLVPRRVVAPERAVGVSPAPPA